VLTVNLTHLSVFDIQFSITSRRRPKTAQVTPKGPKGRQSDPWRPQKGAKGSPKLRQRKPNRIEFIQKTSCKIHVVIQPKEHQSFIQFAVRRAATVPFTTGLLASKLQVFFLSGTVRCVHFTSMLGSLGGHFGFLGLHCGGFCSSGAGLWTPLGAFWRWVHFGGVHAKKYPHILESLLAPKISKVANKLKK